MLTLRAWKIMRNSSFSLTMIPCNFFSLVHPSIFNHNPDLSHRTAPSSIPQPQSSFLVPEGSIYDMFISKLTPAEYQVQSRLACHAVETPDLFFQRLLSCWLSLLQQCWSLCFGFLIFRDWTLACYKSSFVLRYEVATFTTGNGWYSSNNSACVQSDNSVFNKLSQLVYALKRKIEEPSDQAYSPDLILNSKPPFYPYISMLPPFG